jgi:hypothetical protein
MKYARQCSITNEGMNEGWCFGDGQDYAKYEKDAIQLAKDYGYDSIEDAYEDEACYWTEWEDDYQYEEINGVLVEIE